MIMSSAVDRWWSVSELSESMLADRSVPVKQCDMISESVRLPLGRAGKLAYIILLTEL